MKKKNKIIYLGMSADIIHRGHINLINKASKYGDIIIGLLTNKAISSYKAEPVLSYKERETVIKNIKKIKKVIPQTTLDYTENLKKIKPDFVMHGDDWKKGPQSNVRKKVIKTIKMWKGKLIEVPYTDGISSTDIKKGFKEYQLNISRRSKLKILLNSKSFLRIIECHSPIAGQIIEKTFRNKLGEKIEFDGFWSSSLTDSLLKGKPDNQTLDYSSRINMVNDIFDVTHKPMMFDGDNGGKIEHLKFLVKTLDRIGVSAIVLEDKIGLKKNSLFKKQNKKDQDTIVNFSKKIKAAKMARLNKDFMIIARIESFIFDKPVSDAVRRADKYIQAGSDAILIHNKSKKINKLIEFVKKIRILHPEIPLICVPSTFSHIKEDRLEKIGFNVVIYANQMMRGSIQSMKDVAESILENRRAEDIDHKLISIKNTLSFIK